MKEYKFHEFADIFTLNEDDIQSIKESLQKNEYRKEYPIYIYEDKILEGRNRYLACKILNKEAISLFVQPHGIVFCP